MKLVNLSVRRPVGLIMLVLGVLLVGLISLRSLPIDLFPELDIPVAVVATSYEGAAPQEVERLVSEPIESAVSSIQGINRVSSTSTPGASLVLLEFNWGTDISDALYDVRESVDRVDGMLPDGANSPNVMSFDPQQLPVLFLGLSGEDPDRMLQYAEDNIEPIMQRVDGVASVTIEGGKEREIQIELDDTKLRAHGLSSQEIVQALSQENQSVSAGNLRRGSQELQLRVEGEFTSVDDIGQTLIPLQTGEFIQVQDVATIRDTHRAETSLARVNNEEALVLSIMKESDGNTVAVSSGVLDAVDDLQGSLPESMSLSVVMDTAEFIRESVRSVAFNMLIGAAFALLILLFFLRSFRSIFVIGTSIPIALISAFTLMYFTGETINMITMGGLALGIGMMVDSAIVILENMFSYREKGYSWLESAKVGASELGPAVTASTLTSVSVFVPIVFVEGLAAEIFGPLGMTVAIALLMSLLASLTLVPMIFSRLPERKKKRSDADDPLQVADSASSDDREDSNDTDNSNDREDREDRNDRDDREEREDRSASGSNDGESLSGYQMPRVKEGYKRVIQWSLGHRKTVLFSVFLLFVASFATIPSIGAELLPDADQGQMEVRVVAREGSTMEETVYITEQVHAQIDEQLGSALSTNFLSIGGDDGTGMGGGGVNAANFMLMLTPSSERELTTAEAVERLEASVADIAGAEITVMDIAAGFDMGAAPVQVQISGPDWEVLEQLSEEVQWVVDHIDGTHQAESSLEQGRPELQVNVDRDVASQYGVTYQQVMSEILLRFDGQVATRYRTGEEELDVRVVLPEERRQSIQDIENMYIPTATGEQIPLTAVAELNQVQGPVEIQRQDQQRQVNVTAELRDRDLLSVTNELAEMLESVHVPDGYSVHIGGEAEEMADAFGDLTLALILAIFLVYMVMAIQFESFVHPFVIMFALPTTVIGVLFGLFITNTPLSIVVFIGLIMLAGIVVNNAIILVDYINILRRQHEMDRSEAIVEAGQSRLRPILMTTLTTALAMLPLSLGIGEGAEMQAPMAIVIIFGLMCSMFFTLILIPVIYVYMDNMAGRVKGWFVSQDAEPKQTKHA